MASTDGIGVFIGATAGTNGTTGAVPAPLAGQQNYFLTGGGLWVSGGASTGYQTIEGQGSAVPQETTLNFASDSFTVVDNPGSMRTDIFVSGVITWDVVTVNTAMTVQTGYINNSGSLITFTLPTTAIPGDTIRIIGYGAGLWQINQNAGQSIRFGKFNTAVGVGGNLASTNQGDSIEIVCVVANTLFVVGSAQGNINIT